MCSGDKTLVTPSATTSFCLYFYSFPTTHASEHLYLSPCVFTILDCDRVGDFEHPSPKGKQELCPAFFWKGTWSFLPQPIASHKGPHGLNLPHRALLNSAFLVVVIAADVSVSFSTIMKWLSLSAPRHTWHIRSRGGCGMHS